MGSEDAYTGDGRRHTGEGSRAIPKGAQWGEGSRRRGAEQLRFED